MIRFVDLTSFYWTESNHPDNAPLCAFMDTVTDRFVENAHGCHDFGSAEEIDELGPDMGSRCAGLVPPGFWARRAAPCTVVKVDAPA